MLFNGVRSSCDMFARNSDLYFEVSASCAAFSSSDARAFSISAFLRSTSLFCSNEKPGLFFELLVGLLQLFLLCFQSFFGFLKRSRLLLKLRVGFGQFRLARLQFGRQRLRLLQQFFRPHRGGDRVQHDADDFGELIEEGEVDVAEAVERCQLDDRL